MFEPSIQESNSGGVNTVTAHRSPAHLCSRASCCWPAGLHWPERVWHQEEVFHVPLTLISHSPLLIIYDKPEPFEVSDGIATV